MHRRSFIAGSALATLFAAPAVVRAQSVEWQDVAAEDGRWRLQMPKGYQLVTIPGTDGSTTRQYRSTFPGLAMDYSITDYVQAEAGHPLTDEAAMLRRAQDAVRQRWPGSTVLEQGDSQLGRAQGRAFTLAVDQNKGFLAMRFYYLGQRLYQLAVLGRMEYRQSQAVLHFLNSLRLSS
jgi:hypothetical protein